MIIEGDMRTSISKRVQIIELELRVSSLRPLQVAECWTLAPGFTGEARQFRLLRSNPKELETTAWLSTITDISGGK